MLLLWAVDTHRQVASLHLPVFTWYQETVILITDVLSHLDSWGISGETNKHDKLMTQLNTVLCVCVCVCGGGGYMSCVISVGYWLVRVVRDNTLCIRCIYFHLCTFDNSNPQERKAWGDKKYQSYKYHMKHDIDLTNVQPALASSALNMADWAVELHFQVWGHWPSCCIWWAGSEKVLLWE